MIRQFLIIFGYLAVGEIIVWLTGISIPSSIYGKIVAEADRLIDTETVLRRTVQYGFKHYPDYGREAHIQRALDHLDEKYAEGGYLKLWIPESPNAERLYELQQLIKDRKKIRQLVEEIYDQEK